MNNIVILDNEIKQANKLILKDVEGNLLKTNTLQIDASGLNNSLRKMRDGHTFFGPVADYVNYLIKFKKNCIINDFTIEGLKNEGNIKRLFVIYFERNSQKYFLRSINDDYSQNSALIYIKITKPMSLKPKQYISLFQAVLCVTVFEFNLIVVITKDNGLTNEKITYHFDPKDSPVTIGRGDCKIKLNYSSLSKKHCTIYYNIYSNIWEIYDGFENKESTNGTWLLVNSKHEIKEDTLVKIDSRSFKISLV